MMLCIRGVQIASCSQESSSCSSQRTNRCNCEVNNGDILQMLVEEAIENKFQAFKGQINDSIDERIANSQRDLLGKVILVLLTIIHA